VKISGVVISVFLKCENKWRRYFSVFEMSDVTGRCPKYTILENLCERVIEKYS